MNETYKDNKGKTYTCPYCGKVLTEKEFEDLFCSGCQRTMVMDKGFLRIPKDVQ